MYTFVQYVYCIYFKVLAAYLAEIQESDRIPDMKKTDYSVRLISGASLYRNY